MIKSLFNLFDYKIKVELIFLFLLNSFTAFMEVISIGSVPIFLMYMINPADLAEKNRKGDLASLLRMASVE